MIALCALLVAVAVLRGLGFLGVRGLASWKNVWRAALAAMFLFTGASHFTALKYVFLAMIPDALPKSLGLIYLSGLLEIAGAVGLLVPRLRRAAGVGLIFLLIAVFPANVNAAMKHLMLGGEPAESLWMRTPIQLFFAWMLGWSSVCAGATQNDTLGEAPR